MNAEEDGQVDMSMTTDRFNEYQETFHNGITQERFYNCLCVVFNEIITDSRNLVANVSEKELERKFVESSIISSKKAYCFMFANQHYQTHLEIIGFLANVLKDELIKLSKTITKTNENFERLKNLQSELVLKF